jgi:LPS sulfotransferase NodH
MTAAVPDQSYILWFSQRVGSTLLAQALEDTGIAGRPREWLNVPAAELLPTYGAANIVDLRDALWREATTANGVMGLKYGLSMPHHVTVTALLEGLVDGADPAGRLAWSALFPNCKHVFLTRRNKVRLAASWWRAIKTGEWHRSRGETPAETDLLDLYEYDAIEHLFVEASLREAAMQELFDAWSVIPHTVVYEDLVAAFEPTVRALLEFLEIPGRGDAVVPAPATAPTAGDATETWVQRFRRERQASWGSPAW